METKEKNEILKIAFENNQNIITLADSKANTFITIQSLLITIGIAGALISDTFNILKNDVSVGWGVVYVIFLIMYVLTSLIGIITAVNVFSPRGPQEDIEKKRQGIFYFGHISKYHNSNDYIKKVKNTSENDIFDEFCKQIYQIAKIADEKMEFVKLGATFLYINISFTIFMLIFTIILHLVG